MRKFIAITLLLISIAPCLRAQRKEISQARSYIKSGKDLDKAEKLMTDLLAKDSANRREPKIYLTWDQAVQKQYAVGNEKLYLKEKYDTASLFQLAKRRFAILETLDSIDALPDAKGRVRPEYRKKHAEQLAAIRPNLFFGGSYFVRKGDYKTAFAFYDTYLDCDRQPLFEGYAFNAKDTLTAKAAYLATYCGYKAGSANSTLKYAEMARLDTATLRMTLRHMAEAYALKKDEPRRVAILKEGFARYVDSPYFFPRLMDHYTQASKLDSALAVADTALAQRPANILFMYAKANVLLNLERYDEAIALDDSIIARNDSLPDPYFDCATAYLNKALALENGADVRKKKKEIMALYAKARPYMERYRKLQPEAKDKWARPLYRIYLNLNLGKQFDEIDKLLK